MNTASYTSTTTATGGVGKYPLSTETLDFIQTQIKLLECLAGIGGKNYILQGDAGGVVVITRNDGTTEVLELMQKPAFSASVKYVTVITEKEDVKADDEKYLEARIYRRAQFTTAKGEESYDISSFANVSGKALGTFPTNSMLAEQIKNIPATVLEYLKDTLAQKLTCKPLKGVTKEQIDGLRTSCVLSCSESVALFGATDYTLVVTEQGSKNIRQELIQGSNVRYVRTGDRTSWGAWEHQTETAMHLDVKIVGTTVYVRHGAIGDDCSIVLLRKKKRGSWRATGGAKAYSKNKGIKKKRAAKTQYVHFKGIRLTKGTPGKWYVPKCEAVADRKVDGGLIGKEMPGLCSSLFYVSADGFYHIQGCRKKLLLKQDGSKKGALHSGYAQIGLQIARLNGTGGKDSGGEIVRMKYRVRQYASMFKVFANGKRLPIAWQFRRTFSME